MNNKALSLGKEYARILRSKLGRRLKQVIMFGSQVRGDAREGSDYDVVVVVDERTSEIREAVLDAGVEIMNLHEALFAALTYSEQEWDEARKFPLGWNIKEKGVAL